MCLVNTSNNSLTRRLFRTLIILFALKKNLTLYNDLADTGCFKIYAIINKILILNIYEVLKIELVSLSKPKSLRKYNKKIFSKQIIYYILLKIDINNYRKAICFILIASLSYNIILKKL